MFINISNHPSAKWSEEQTHDALTVGGEVVDLPFPNVPAEAGEAEVEALASKVMEAVSALVDWETGILPTVLVQGEMGLTLSLVARLQDFGAQVVHATTERVSVEKDGIKTSIFRFVRFRQYRTVAHW